MIQNEPFGNNIDYTFMNLGVGATHINAPNLDFNFYHNCFYHIFKESLPHAVFIGYGAMDTLVRDFNNENFIQDYVKLIKETQNLPTKPAVFIVLPNLGLNHDCAEQAVKMGVHNRGDKDWFKLPAGWCNTVDPNFPKDLIL